MEIIRDKNLEKCNLAMILWGEVKSTASDTVVKKVVEVRLDYLRVIFAELGFLRVMNLKCAYGSFCVITLGKVLCFQGCLSGNV